jgi:small conductance mechanosensitive channel
VLGELGLNLGPLIAGAGIAGVALGFGAQTLVRDFLAGIFMLVEDQFGVGDVVDVGGVSGVVEGVSLRVTRLRDVEGVVWHVPNGEIKRVGNKSQDWSRAVLDVQVVHGTDLGRAQEVLRSVAAGMRDDDRWSSIILEEPEVWGVESVGSVGITLRLVLKTRPADQWDVQRDLRRRINDAFIDAGIQVPVVQQVLLPPDSR